MPNEFEYGDLGKKVYGTLSVPLGSSNPTTVTRAVDFSENAMVKIDSYWIGLFDTQTGELVGSAQDNAPRKENGTRNTLYNNSTPFAVNDIDIWYYENHPEVYIVGVINFNNVKAKTTPKETNTVNLEDLLPTIDSFDKFTKISIDTQSADAANLSNGSDESCPLMMGFYRTGTSATHATVTPEGNVTQDDTKVRISEVATGKKLSDGAIKLQRLLAEMNYVVSAGSDVTIRSLEYMVVNNPMDVYLMEHATDDQGGSKEDEKTYMDHTPNSADISGNYASTNFSSVYPHSDGSYSFSYQAYENKHWGRKWNFPSFEDEDGNLIQYDQNSIQVREKRYDDPNAENGKSNVFRTLCQFVGAPYNNSASYVVLKATVSFKDSNKMVFIDAETQESLGYGFEQTNASDAVIYYTIHEGATSKPDGSVNNGSSKGYDYQRTRNTRYQYWIQINGLDEISVQAKQEEGFHNDAISGDVWNTDIFEFDYGNPYQYRTLTVSFTNKEELEALTWRVYYKTPDGEFNYGDWERNPEAPSYYPEWPYLSESKLTNADELPDPHKSDVNIVDATNQGVKIPINELKKRSNSFNYPLTLFVTLDPITDFDISKEDQYRRGFYMSLNDERKDEDGCEIHQRVFGFEQGAFDNRIQLDYYSSPRSVDLEYKDIIKVHNVPWEGNLVSGAYIKWDDNVTRNVEKYRIEIDDVVDETLNKEDVIVYSGSSFVMGYNIKKEDLQQLGTGLHSVRITPILDSNIYKPIVPVWWTDALYISNNAKWDFADTFDYFSQEQFIGYSISTYFRSNYPIPSSTALRYNGLFVVGGNGVNGPNGNCIQTQGDGYPFTDLRGNTVSGSSDVGRYFFLTVNGPGKVVVRARSANTSADGKGLKFYQGYQSNYYGSKSSLFYRGFDGFDWAPQEKETQNITQTSSQDSGEYTYIVSDVEEVADIIISPVGNIQVFSIEFVPNN